MTREPGFTFQPLVDPPPAPEGFATPMQVTPQEHVAQAALEVAREYEQAADSGLVYERQTCMLIAKAFMQLAERLEPE